MNRTHCLVALILLLIVRLNIACAETIPVGVSLPLTGMAASYGTAFRQGLDLYLEEHPAEQGKIKLIYDDHQYEGARVVASVRKLTEIDHARLLLVWGAMPSDIASPLTRQFGVPMFVVTFQPNAKDKPLVAAFESPTDRYVGLMQRIVKEKPVRKIGIVGANVGASLAFLELARPVLPTVMYEEIVPTSTLDFTSLIAKIRNKPVDGLLLMLTPEQMLPFAKAAAAQKYQADIISGDLVADDDLRAQLKSLMGGVTYMYGNVDSAFKARYRVRYGSSSNMFEAANGYSFGMVLSAIVSEPLLSSGEAQVANLSKINLTNTPIGPIKFQYNKEHGVHVITEPVIISE